MSANRLPNTPNWPEIEIQAGLPRSVANAGEHAQHNQSGAEQNPVDRIVDLHAYHFANIVHKIQKASTAPTRSKIRISMLIHSPLS